jgi:DNA replication licensing factor MCM2
MNDDEFSEADQMAREMRFQRMKEMIHGGEDGGADHDMIDGALDFEEVKGQLSQWI